jgi:F-type H+-transporting ATPase subunit b
VKNAALFLLSTAFACAAEEHGAAAHDAGNELMWKWFNFAILAGGLGYLFVKSGLPFFRDRAAGIVKDIADATQTKQSAEARAADLEKKIANLSGEIDQMKAQTKAEMEAEAKRIQDETKTTLAKIAAQADAEISSATKAAKQELSQHAAALAVDLAAGKLRTGSPQAGLVDSFVRDLEKLKN